jgi:hypothetical protein
MHHPDWCTGGVPVHFYPKTLNNPHTLIKVMQMQWIILLLCNTHVQDFTSFDSKMQSLDYFGLIQYPHA